MPKIRHEIELIRPHPPRMGDIAFRRLEGTETRATYRLFPQFHPGSGTILIGESVSPFEVFGPLRQRHGTRFFRYVHRFFQRFANHAGIPIVWEPRTGNDDMRGILRTAGFKVNPDASTISSTQYTKTLRPHKAAVVFSSSEQTVVRYLERLAAQKVGHLGT